MIRMRRKLMPLLQKERKQKKQKILKEPMKFGKFLRQKVLQLQILLQDLSGKEILNIGRLILQDFFWLRLWKGSRRLLGFAQWSV